MDVKLASYRGFLGTKDCGLRHDYICDVDVRCLVKKQCNGLHECNITVDDNLMFETTPGDCGTRDYGKSPRSRTYNLVFSHCRATQAQEPQ